MKKIKEWLYPEGSDTLLLTWLYIWFAALTLPSLVVGVIILLKAA
jgi:hypothetical protein